MVKSQNNWGIFALEFIGSLIFLALVFSSNYNSFMNGSWGAAALWLPILYAIAAVSSIALFFISFASIAGWKGAEKGAMCATVSAAVTLFALTAGNSLYFISAIIGFVIAFIGAGLGYRK